MNEREITLWMGEQEYDALRRALLARDTDPRAEMQKRLEACYRKLVPSRNGTESQKPPMDTVTWVPPYSV